MPRGLPPLHALAAFEAAARLGGFAQASQELCVTPSAVSHRIRQLESQLGTPLFERVSGGVRPTTAGRLYLDKVREAFAMLAETGRALQAPQERLRISVPPTFARQLLMPRLPEYLRLNPDVEIEVHLSIPLLDVTAEAADVEIRWGAGHYPERQVLRLFEDEAMPLASPDLISALQLRAPADLSRATLLRSPLLPWKPWFDAAGLARGEPERGAVFNDLGMLFEVAASGLGVAMGTRRLSAAWLATHRLAPLFGLAVAAPYHYYAVTTPAQASRRVVGDFIDWLVASLR